MQKQVKFEQAVKTKYPEQIVIVVAKDKNGKPNPAVAQRRSPARHLASLTGTGGLWRGASENKK